MAHVGLDKDCQLIIELEDSTAVITDRGADLKAVINRAVHRAVQTIRRQLKHQQLRTRERVSLQFHGRSGCQPRFTALGRLLHWMPRAEV